MTPFANSRIKRRIAPVMVVFWLFALGAGWANACLLQERNAHQHADVESHVGTPIVSAGHVGALGDHEADPAPGKAPCLKVCDESSQSLVKWPSALELPNLAPPTVVAWSVSVAALDSPRPGHVERRARAGLPLRTRYSRLAL
ncbi:MAG: hypothetical protein ABIQ87_01810 [Rubrivivax sp.]